MKTKNLLWIIVITVALLVLFGCSTDEPLKPEDRAKYTTVEVLNNIDTSLQVSLDLENYYVYVLNSDDEVIFKGTLIEKDKFLSPMVPVHGYILLFMSVALFFFFIGFFVTLSHV